MRCENCGELLKESQHQVLDKAKNDKSDTNRTVIWTCGNCGQVYNKAVQV